MYPARSVASHKEEAPWVALQALAAPVAGVLPAPAVRVAAAAVALEAAVALVLAAGCRADGALHFTIPTALKKKSSSGQASRCSIC